ncbi:global nitrogen regulator NtcA [compost metagenome]
MTSPTVPSLSPAHQAALLSNPWFGGLPEPIRQAMLAHGHASRLTVGHALFLRGDPADGIYAVLEGCIRLSGVSDEGHETVLSLHEPGSWFGETSVLDTLPRTHDAFAHTAARVLRVPAASLEALLAAHPALGISLLRLECTRLRAALAALEAFSQRTLEQRFAGRLLALASAYGANTPQGIRIELRLPQELLAQLVGTTRQRINQVLKAWEVAGLVAQRYGRIAVLDPAGLERLATR